MRYSLLSRFQGCLVGAALGEVCYHSESLQVAGWSRMAVYCIESLIRKGNFDLNDWDQQLSNEFPNLGIINGAHTGELLGLSIPLALFYHENEIKLRQNLLFLVENRQQDLELRDGALAVGYTIAQSLKEKLNSFALIPQVITFIGSSSPLTQALTQVQTLLEQGSGIERAVSELYCQEALLSSSVALALYCFLSTLEDLRLSILRAARTSVHPITTTIVGALAGAYNSTAGIPIPLQMILSHSDQALGRRQTTTVVEMLELAETLLAVWSGMYDQSLKPNALIPITAIAAPNVIRLP